MNCSDRLFVIIAQGVALDPEVAFLPGRKKAVTLLLQKSA
jgi:hypothetical protein